MLTLVMNAGLAEEQTFPLTPGARITIGRTKDNAVLCLHKSLSRTHAELGFDGATVQLTDLQSKNGVFVNGRRVARAELRGGDTFRCGDVTFLLQDSVAPQEIRSGGGRPSASSHHDPLNNTLPSPFAIEPGRSRPPPLPTAAPTDDARAKERLFLLMRASELCVTELPVDKLLQELVSLATQTLDVDRISVLLIDETTLELRLRVGKSFKGPKDRSYSYRVVDWVLDHGSPAAFDDVSVDRSLGGDIVQDGDIRAAMCVPLNPGGGVIGLLYADSLTRPAAFRSDDLAVFRALGNLAAVAIESAQLRASERPTLARR